VIIPPYQSVSWGTYTGRLLFRPDPRLCNYLHTISIIRDTRYSHHARKSCRKGTQRNTCLAATLCNSPRIYVKRVRVLFCRWMGSTPKMAIAPDADASRSAVDSNKCHLRCYGSQTVADVPHLRFSLDKWCE